MRLECLSAILYSAATFNILFNTTWSTAEYSNGLFFLVPERKCKCYSNSNNIIISMHITCIEHATIY